MYDYLKTFNVLTQSELDKLLNKTTTKIIKKNAYLIEEGSISKEIVFIKKGILRSFYINTKGEEITNCLAFENQFMSALSSFIIQNSTDENIQALVDTEVEVLSKNTIEQLYKESIQWQEVGRKLIEMEFVQLERRIASFQKQSAQQRYDDLFKKLFTLSRTYSITIYSNVFGHYASTFKSVKKQIIYRQMSFHF